MLWTQVFPMYLKTDVSSWEKNNGDINSKANIKSLLLMDEHHTHLIWGLVLESNV